MARAGGKDGRVANDKESSAEFYKRAAGLARNLFDFLSGQAFASPESALVGITRMKR